LDLEIEMDDATQPSAKLFEDGELMKTAGILLSFTVLSFVVGALIFATRQHVFYSASSLATKHSPQPTPAKPLSVGVSPLMSPKP
jgi:hypothetical protein